MGVPYYFSHIVKNHSNIIKKITDNTLKNDLKTLIFQIDNLYLDCNSIIYDAVHTIDFNNLKESDVRTILRIVCNKIDEYISLLKPTNNVYIAFDGVAPVAKLDQQRTRRYKSVYQSSLTRSIMKNTGTDPWNTTAITPGTAFMRTLNETLYAHYADASKYNVEQLIVSCSDEPGEGEHKLFQYIRDFPQEHQNKNTVIYGLDADLIMLSINHLPLAPTIYLYRETPQFIQSLNPDLDPNEGYLLDIPLLAETIEEDMNTSTNNKQTHTCSRIYDYIFLCFFLGNDFLPHFPAINIRTGGIDKMISAYKSTIAGTSNILTDGKNIYWNNVRTLVLFLSNNEDEWFKIETKMRNKRERSTLLLAEDTPENKLKKLDSLPLYDRTLEKYIDPFKPDWETRYYKALFRISINDKHREKISTNYMEGLEWTMKYYTTGCYDWRWSYHYNYPPLLKDLYQYLPHLSKDNNKEFVLYREPAPVKDITQLCYVLPRQSLPFLPDVVYKRLLNEHGEWYKTDCDFSWAYCRYFWEAHVNLPVIELAELEAFLCL